MNLADRNELDVLECSGDFELAQKFGDITRKLIDRASSYAADILGADPESVRQGVEEAFQIDGKPRRR